MESTSPNKEDSLYRKRFAQALGRTIKVIRTDRGMERAELADKAGITYSSLTEIENGNRAPSPTRLERISSALELRVFELVRAAEERMETQGEGRIPRSTAEELAEMPSRDSRPSRLSSPADYAMQPSLRGSRRDLRSAVLELEQLMQEMDSEDVGRLLDYARRLAR